MRRNSILAAVLAVAGASALQAQADTTALLARARRLQQQAPLVDGHNDLPWEIRQKAHGDLEAMNPDRALPEQDTDVARLKQGGVGAVFWAAYVPVETMRHAPGPARVALEQIDLIHRMVARSPDMEMALCASGHSSEWRQRASGARARAPAASEQAPARGKQQLGLGVLA